MKAILNGRLVLPEQIVSGRALLISQGRIADIVDLTAVPPEAEVTDAGGRLVTPGLIDLHIHGAQGHTFNDATPPAFAAITAAAASAGVTSLLATTATGPLDQLAAALQQAAAWADKESKAFRLTGAQLLGVHVEGPYFAPSQAGAQDPAHLRIPTDGAYEQLLEYAAVIRIVTYAPELPDALALTKRLTELGIVPAAGHSAAREEDLRPHLDAGLRHMIHIWSGQSSTVREGPWRKPGLLEVSLVDERLTVEMIADGKHLPPTLMRLAYKCIGPNRLCLISDATSGAGLPNGARFRMAELEYEVQDGVGMLLDGSAFAGSTTLLNKMVGIVIEQVGVPLVEAVRMASLTPARVIGVDGRKGSLEAGKDADVVIFEEDWQPWQVMIGGEWYPMAAQVEAGSR